MVVTVILTTLTCIRQQNPWFGTLFSLRSGYRSFIVASVATRLVLFDRDLWDKNQCYDNCLSRKKKNNSRRQREARVNTRMTKSSLDLISYEWLRGKQNQCKSDIYEKNENCLISLTGRAPVSQGLIHIKFEYPKVRPLINPCNNYDKSVLLTLSVGFCFCFATTYRLWKT